MTVPIIVQARMGSTRLPGKTLLPFGDTTVLAHQLRALSRSTEAGERWVATTWRSEDNNTCYAATKAGWFVYRPVADSEDVLVRFYECVEMMAETPDAIVRVCADRPFVNPDLIDAMIRYWRRYPGLDYLAPHDVSTSGELVSVKALRRAHAEATDPYDREHVTPWIKRRPDLFNVARFPTTIDTPADYETVAA